MGEQHAGSTEGVAVHRVRACGHDYKQCGTGQAAAAGMGPTRQTWMVSVPFSESVLISTYEWRTACTYAADRPPCTLLLTQAAGAIGISASHTALVLGGTALLLLGGAFRFSPAAAPPLRICSNRSFSASRKERNQ
jgi:hypothetical protein